MPRSCQRLLTQENDPAPKIASSWVPRHVQACDPSSALPTPFAPGVALRTSTGATHRPEHVSTSITRYEDLTRCPFQGYAGGAAVAGGRRFPRKTTSTAQYLWTGTHSGWFFYVTRSLEDRTDRKSREERYAWPRIFEGWRFWRMRKESSNSTNTNTDVTTWYGLEPNEV